MTSQQFYIPTKYAEQAQEFFAYYDMEKVITCSAVELKTLPNRVCRFCNKTSISTTFNKAAHTIPELLGNHAWLSDFECDECNKKFGLEYESHLAHFLGISRTLSGTQGKNKVPDFTSPRYKLTATHDVSGNPYGTVTFTRKNELDDTFSIDKDTGTTTIKFQSNPYTPLKVYKAFLKMALSCLPEKYLNAYKLAFEYLMTDQMDRDCNAFNEISKYSLPQQYAIEDPVAILFKKRTSQNNVFTHVFQLFYGNLIFQFGIPLQIADAYYATLNNEMMIYTCPPLFFDAQVSERVNLIDIPFHICSLSSNDSCKDGWGALQLPIERTLNTREDGIDYARIKKIEIIRQKPT